MQESESPVPGLFVFSNWFDQSSCVRLQERLISLYKTFQSTIPQAREQIAKVPQPEMVLTEEGGLEEMRPFWRVQASFEERQMRCEWFPSYGGEGHDLLYFRGNENLPSFLAPFLPDIIECLNTHALTDTPDELQWRCTLNVYKSSQGAVSGFPFHVDIPANGTVTMILNLLRAATFQIAQGPKLVSLSLPVGALVLLSGESRYQWKHRVIPMDAHQGRGEIERMSVVLGVQ